jgi:hypothetical protein
MSRGASPRPLLTVERSPALAAQYEVMPTCHTNNQAFTGPPEVRPAHDRAGRNVRSNRADTPREPVSNELRGHVQLLQQLPTPLPYVGLSGANPPSGR